MSAFVVEDETINNVVNWMFSSEYRCYMERRLAEIGFTTDMNTRLDWMQTLGTAMFDLNVQAVDARYGEGEAAGFRPLDYKHHFTFRPTNIFTVYKSLECWLYQCAEGDVPDTELYKFFDNYVRTMIANEIIHNDTRYNEAKWG